MRWRMFDEYERLSKEVWVKSDAEDKMICRLSQYYEASQRRFEESLSALGFHPERQGGYLSLSLEEYENFKNFSKVSPEFPKELSIYAPLKNHEWNTLIQNIKVVSDGGQADFWDKIREGEKVTPYNSKILRNLCRHIDIGEALGEDPLQVTMTPEGNKMLVKLHARGAKKGKNEIVLKTDFPAVGTFFHEVEHILQERYPALEKSFENNQDYSHFIERQAIEADSKAISELNNKNSSFDFIREFYRKKYREEMRDSEWAQNLPLEKKYVSIMACSRAKADEQAHHLMMQILLSHSRFEAFQKLSQENVPVTTSQFHQMMNTVEDWKEYYFDYHKFARSDTQNNFESVQQHLKNKEKAWKDFAGVTVDLSPCHIVTPTVAKMLDMTYAIYGIQDTDMAKGDYAYDISDDVMKQAQQMEQSQDFEGMYHLCRTQMNNHAVFKRTVNQLPENYDPKKMDGLVYYRALLDMKTGKNPFEIIQRVIEDKGYFIRHIIGNYNVDEIKVYDVPKRKVSDILSASSLKQGPNKEMNPGSRVSETALYNRHSGR